MTLIYLALKNNFCEAYLLPAPPPLDVSSLPNCKFEHVTPLVLVVLVRDTVTGVHVMAQLPTMVKPFVGDHV